MRGRAGAALTRAGRWPQGAPPRRHLHRRGVCRALARGDDVPPLVVLVGWLGAKKCHLYKYTQMWQDLGHPTYSIRPRTSSILLPALGDCQAARFLADLEQLRVKHQRRQLLLHIFSNAGFLFVGTALRLLATDPQPQASWLMKAAGIIFDSAPARLTPDISARGFTAAALGLPAEGIEFRRPRLVFAAKQVFGPALSQHCFATRQDEIWEAWETHAPVCQQLYLYSKNDALIPPQEIQRFQQDQAARGAEIQERLWANSPHCEHLRTHRQEYRMLVSDFAAALHVSSNGLVS